MKSERIGNPQKQLFRLAYQKFLVFMQIMLPDLLSLGKYPKHH